MAAEDGTEIPFWRRKSLEEMTDSEWESLCDGCGRCCLNKLEEEGTDRTFYTNVGCRLLDGETCRCRDYANRLEQVDDCVRLTPEKPRKRSPGYRRPAPTCCSPRARTFTGGIRSSPATRRRCTRPASRSAAASRASETDVPDEDLEDHIVELAAEAAEAGAAASAGATSYPVFAPSRGRLRPCTGFCTFARGLSDR